MAVETSPLNINSNLSVMSPLLVSVNSEKTDEFRKEAKESGQIIYEIGQMVSKKDVSVLVKD